MDSPATTPDGAALSPARRRGLTVGLAVLLAVLLLAGVLRIGRLPHAPPGLNQDEAANAWNAWCLLTTGRDQAGNPWPVFYTRALGGNRSTLYLYALLPFQALGGLNVWTTRLPAAVGGVLTVLLLYWIAARLFNRPTGLVAAALLALNPWHIQLSRTGHEASLGPLLVTVSLAALLWAGFPLRDGAARAVWWKGLVAGLVTGISCYGYPAVRLFVPLFLVSCVVLTGRSWWRLIRNRPGIVALGALLIGVGVTFGPLAYQHVAHPEQIARRATDIWLWEESDVFETRAAKVLTRYAAHFGPDFLLLRGDHYEVQSPHGFGPFHWYTLPLMVAGLIVALRHVRQSSSARVLLCGVLLYPVGDVLHRHVVAAADGTPQASLHALRSAPGLGVLILLAAVGAVVIGRAIWRRNRTAALAAAAIFAAVALRLDVRFLAYFFGPHNQRPVVRRDYHVDLVEACAWLRPRADAADAVFITTKDMNMPYIVTLVGLGYDPRQWFRDLREVRTFNEFDYYFRVGKFHYLYDKSSLGALAELQRNDRPDRVIFIVRPGEARLSDPVHTVRGPDGEPALLVYERVY